MTRSRHLFAVVLVCATAMIAAAFGAFQSIDNALWNMRFSAADRPASGEVVLIEVDPMDVARIQSASAMRGMYAAVVDIALGAGARDVVVETRLGGPTGRAGDDMLAAALSRGEGRVRTVAYAPPARTGPPHGFQLPLDRFANVAPPVITGTMPDSEGMVRRSRTGAAVGGARVPSLAVALNPDRAPGGDSFAVDFSINADTIPVAAVHDVLSGRIDVGQFAGKQVVIGLRGATLQESALVPRFGVVSASTVHVLATETLKQGRVLTGFGPWSGIALSLAIGAAFILVGCRVAPVFAAMGALAAALVLEVSALGLLSGFGIAIDTAAAHATLIGMVLIALMRELRARGLLFAAATRERDSMRGILSRVVADNFDGVVIADHRHRIRAASRFASNMVATDLVDRQIEDVLPPVFAEVLVNALSHGKTVDEVAELTLSLQPGDDRIIEYVVTTSEVAREEASAESAGPVACLTFRDVTERRRSEAQLNYLARHDPQTGALSRVAFVQSVAEQLTRSVRHGRGVCVLLVGIDRLKKVNDTLGHAYGDRLLRQVVSRLQLAGASSVARLESNSFAVVREGAVSDDAVQGCAREVIAQVVRPYALEDHQAIVGVSIGMTDSERSGSDADTLIQDANMALSVAADRQGNAIVAFTREMTDTIKTRQEMEIALRAALARDEFFVHYQPQVDLASGAIVGVEALARWTHPELGHISPGAFIPAAEETGLIIELGRWILKTACAEVARWPHPVRLSVNVSPMQFDYGDIVADVRDALAGSGLAPDMLDIEITEGLLVTETCHVTQALATLRADGVRVALDDFGTGYSSLSYLGRLPVDTIKIDQSFVRRLPDDPQATAIIQAVLMLSESLKKDVIAEGIETTDQAWLLQLAGCRTGQGYHFGRPASGSETLAAIGECEEDAFVQARTG